MEPKDISFEDLASEIRRRGRDNRSITALVGAPGAGKSTAAGRLAALLNAEQPDSAAIFAMDGYHYDDAILNARGWRPRKGAPHTYDVAGFGHMLTRLKANAEDEIAVPIFDRSIEIARNAAEVIPGSVRHLIVEGNYLLLNQSGWSDLTAYFDTTVFLDVPLTELQRRLEERWAWMSPDDRLAKLEENDLPNARLVVSESAPAEFVLRWAGGAK